MGKAHEEPVYTMKLDSVCQSLSCSVARKKSFMESF